MEQMNQIDEATINAEAIRKIAESLASYAPLRRAQEQLVGLGAKRTLLAEQFGRAVNLAAAERSSDGLAGLAKRWMAGEQLSAETQATIAGLRRELAIADEAIRQAQNEVRI